jgi:hypothetical protein
MKNSTSTNRLASFSLLFAGLTLLSFCGGVAPIPLSALVCYPIAILLGLAAFFSGWMALRQIRTTAEAGRWLAWLGLGLGALIILAVLCLSALTGLALYYGADTLKTLWPQFTP